MIAGDGLCDERAVRVLCDEGPRYTRELIEWGAALRPRRRRRACARIRRRAQRPARAARARRHGREIGRVLWERMSAVARIRVLKNTLAVSAIVEDGRCLGVRFIDDDGQSRAARSRAPRCSPPAAQARCFAETDESRMATGDGVAIALRARRPHRRSWSSSSSTRPCSTSRMRRDFCFRRRCAARARGLSNATGEPFMLRYHPAGDLAPRDVVSRSIVLRIAANCGSDLSAALRHLDRRRRAPAISR